MGVGRVRGTFTLASAELTVGEDGVTASGVRAVVGAASVVTGNEQRDQHIRSADFLDVENRGAKVGASVHSHRAACGDIRRLLSQVNGTPSPAGLRQATGQS